MTDSPQFHRLILFGEVLKIGDLEIVEINPLKVRRISAMLAGLENESDSKTYLRPILTEKVHHISVKNTPPKE